MKNKNKKKFEEALKRHETFTPQQIEMARDLAGSKPQKFTNLAKDSYRRNNWSGQYVLRS